MSPAAVIVDGPGIRCPECGDVMPTSIVCDLTALGSARQEMTTEADLSDVWAHMWGHADD